jgi:hypothetical protein
MLNSRGVDIASVRELIRQSRLSLITWSLSWEGRMLELGNSTNYRDIYLLTNYT